MEGYNGAFGEFTATDGMTDGEAIITQAVAQHNYKGEDIGATSVANVKVVHCESEEIAAAEFDKYLTVKDAPYLAKNGSGATATIVSKTDKLGMADKYVTVLNGTKNIKDSDIGKEASGAEIKDVKASTYGADQIYVLYASYIKTDDATKQQYSQFSMVMQDGKNIVVINQSTKNEFSMYYNVAIDSDSTAVSGEKFITQADFESELIKFCKAF